MAGKIVMSTALSFMRQRAWLFLIHLAADKSLDSLIWFWDHTPTTGTRFSWPLNNFCLAIMLSTVFHGIGILVWELALQSCSFNCLEKLSSPYCSCTAAMMMSTSLILRKWSDVIQISSVEWIHTVAMVACLHCNSLITYQRERLGIL